LRRVLITGLGCATPCGIGPENLWANVAVGRSGIGRIQAFDPAPYASQVAGEVLDFRPEDFLARREIVAFSRYFQLGVAAARLAWDDAGLPSPRLHSERIGAFIGSTAHCLGHVIAQARLFHEKGLSRVHPMIPVQYPGSLGSEISIALGFTGATYVVCTSCTAAADAIGLALGQIASGMLDGALVGGSDAPVYPLIHAGFDRLEALSRLNEPAERASRPFSADRNGFVLAEGAGMLMLEAEDVARERGARIYAEIVGFGATSDAYHHLAPAPGGNEGVRAVVAALAHAGVSPDDIDYVNAHGTGTPLNDSTETAILHRVFGERARHVPVSSSKSMHGHMIGASPAVELIIAVLALTHGVIPPTINLTTPDPACDLDYVTEGARSATLRTVLSTSFGFGGRNAALVARRADA